MGMEMAEGKSARAVVEAVFEIPTQPEVSVGAGITCQFSGCRGASLVVHADQGVPLRTLREAGAGSGDGSATENGKLFLRRR